MLADAGEGKFQRVVFLKLDRLGRNLRDLLNISHRLDELGVGIVSIHDAFDTGTSSGKLFFSILGAVTEFERDLITERTTSGRLGAARNGRYLGGQTPFGYDYETDTKRLVVKDTEAAAVRRIYRMYVDEGLSHEKIARRLNDEGVPTKTTRVAARSHDGIKKGWMGSQIGKMLIDPLYKGKTYYNRTRKSGGRHPVEEWIPVEAPSIVTVDEWEAARLRAKRNRRESQRPQDKRSEFLLSGLIRCQPCGQSMSAVIKRHRSGNKIYTYRHYVCVGQRQYKTKCRTPQEPKAEKIEGKVMDLLTHTFSDPVKVLAACRAYGEQLRGRTGGAGGPRSDPEASPREGRGRAPSLHRAVRQGHH
jgi:site-specific DNA recombinase